MWPLLKQILFRLDAETAHNLSIRSLSLLNTGLLKAATSSSKKHPQLRSRVMGINFETPLGLAAGFDKNGELLPCCQSLGFSFAEIGTVTPRPQGGNPRPRLHRDLKNTALFNQMGFNNIGAYHVSENLKKHRPYLNDSFVVGVNIGKNKETDNDKAYLDYQEAIKHFRGLADYVTINVSSPNTPGLRDLQNIDSLCEIIESVQNEISKWEAKVPLCLKIAPENEPEQLMAFAEKEKDWGLSAWVLCNTLKGMHKEQVGGWSGSPLSQESTRVLKEMLKHTSLPIVSVGGVMTPEDAFERFRLGAKLVQIYSGWVYGGPRFPAKIKDFLSKELSVGFFNAQ